MRIAMIGLGDIAQKAYLPLISNSPNITPILCTRNIKTIERLSQKYRIKETCTELKELILLKPDAVMIHSNTESHFTLAKQCLTAGIPIFIDKPISYHYHQCEALINIAEQKSLSLTVGFNRRFAPLYQPLLKTKPAQIRYQKNRVNHPDETRTYIFDDFIHVIDFVRHASGRLPDNFEVFAHKQKDKLANIQVQWTLKNQLITASMNRISGCSEERLEYFTDNEKWQIDNLSEGLHYKNNQTEILKFSDWDKTLHKRGFVNMIDDFLDKINSGHKNQMHHKEALETHLICEKIIKKIIN